MFNLVIAPDVYTCDRIALQGAFVIIDGVLQKNRQGVRAWFATKRRRHAGRMSMWLRNASAMCKS
jgi:hypothetical protein